MYQTINTFKGSERVEGYTKQGICCDDEYIYFLYYKLNAVAIYDWDGNFVTLIYFDVLGEPENISVVNGTIYVACGESGIATLYKLTDLTDPT